MKPYQKPLACYYLQKIRHVKHGYIHLTFYDLCMLAPFASEARVRFAMRQLMQQGHAVPFVRATGAQEDPKATFGWILTPAPYVLQGAYLGRELLSDKLI